MRRRVSSVLSQELETALYVEFYKSECKDNHFFSYCLENTKHTLFESIHFMATIPSLRAL